MRPRNLTRVRLAAFAATLLASAMSSAVGCHSSASAPAQNETPDSGASMPFQADPVTVYVAKVKYVLVGLPPTDAEIASVQADPTQLVSLIDGWMQLPEYTEKMMRFFELAFQQTQVGYSDYADMFYPDQIDINPTTVPLLLQNAQESFARTMLQLISQGQPLTQGTTTTTLMMTTAMKELYAFLDVYEVDDNSKITDAFKNANPKLNITVGAASGAIPMSETLDPTSANYMHWYDPDVSTANSTVAGCTVDPLVYPASSITLHYLLYGSLAGWTNSAGTKCPPFDGSSTAPQLQASDFSDWTMVTLRAPMSGEEVSTFYDLPTLRTSTELVLNTPRVGFFSTPTFAANWPTNTSNTMRVTMNQTFIVALGSMVDGTDTTTPPGVPGLDTGDEGGAPAHASDPACYNCHKILDPSRSILSATYSWNYHQQIDPTWTSQPGMFAFRGVIAPVTSVSDLGNTLATHPYFAPGWVQKLCYWANSSACDPTDPVFQQIVSDFTSSNYSWNGLVKELLSSPIVTNATETATAAQNGEIVAVSRRDHLCAALDARLGLTDVCQINSALQKNPTNQTTIGEIAEGLPSDAYGRGAVAPVLPNTPTLFYRAGIENICEGVASQVIDVPTSKQVAGVQQWSSSQPQAAITQFVSEIMGLTSTDPRTAQATQLLQAHYAAAIAAPNKATPTAALQSTFMAACMAPTFVSIGM
jgi:hypothetical protein